MEQFTVYLAGNIRPENADSDSEWRTYVEDKLNEHSIQCLNPLRTKSKEFWEHYTPQEIIMRDIKDIEKSDLVLACLEENLSIGTPAEMGIAYYIRKPVVLVSKSERIRKHYWGEGLTVRRFEDLEKALDYIINYWAGNGLWDPRV